MIALDAASKDKANVKGETNELYTGGRVLEGLIVSRPKVYERGRRA